MDAETRRRLAAARAWLTHCDELVLQGVIVDDDTMRPAAWLVLEQAEAALPAEPPPDLVALVREWQTQERFWRPSSVNRRADEAALLAYPLPEGTEP